MNVRLLDCAEITGLIAGKRSGNSPDAEGEFLVCSACELFLAVDKLRKNTEAGRSAVMWGEQNQFKTMIKKGTILVVPLDDQALRIGLFSEDDEGHTTLENAVTTAPTPEASANAVVRKQLSEEWQWQIETENG